MRETGAVLGVGVPSAQASMTLGAYLVLGAPPKKTPTKKTLLTLFGRQPHLASWRHHRRDRRAPTAKPHPQAPG